MTNEYKDLLRLGQHANGDFDPIPDGGLGTHDNPYQSVPDDFKEKGVPYGAYCRCAKCRELFRSTIMYDCYDDGGVLICETCFRRSISRPSSVVQHRRNVIEERGAAMDLERPDRFEPT